MVYNIYVIFMQSDDNGFYNHKIQKLKKSSKMNFPVCGFLW